MKLAGYVAALLLAVLVHVVLMRFLPPVARLVDPFMVLVVVFALETRPLGGMVAGTAAGLTKDALTGSLYGLHGVALTIIGFVVARIARSVTANQPAVIGLLLAIGVLVESAVLLVLLRLLSREVLAPELIWVGARTGVTALLGVAVVSSAGRSLRRFELWKRIRRRRVKLPG